MQQYLILLLSFLLSFPPFRHSIICNCPPIPSSPWNSHSFPISMHPSNKTHCKKGFITEVKLGSNAAQPQPSHNILALKHASPVSMLTRQDSVLSATYPILLTMSRPICVLDGTPLNHVYMISHHHQRSDTYSARWYPPREPATRHPQCWHRDQQCPAASAQKRWPNSARSSG